MATLKKVVTIHWEDRAGNRVKPGTPGAKSTPDGWLNRALPPDTGAGGSPLRAASFGPDLPRSLRGRNDAVAVSALRDFKVADTSAVGVFESMYGASKDQMLNGTGRETFEAMKMVESIEKRPYTPEGGASYPSSRIGQNLAQIAQLIKADVGLEVAFTDMGGWDNHVNEVGGKVSEGALANVLNQFGQALAAFHIANAFPASSASGFSQKTCLPTSKARSDGLA